MKAAYLLLDAASLAFPLAFSRSVRFGFGRDWKKAWAAVLLSAVPFIAWDIWFTRAGVWSFNPRHLLGPSLLGLPMEEILFFLAIPFACLFIYAQFRRGLPAHGSPSAPRPAGIARVAWAGIAMGLFLSAAVHPDRLYTVAVCLLGAAVAAALAACKPRYGGALLAAVAVQYVPFLIVNGILTALPVVLYRPGDILGLRIGTIPVEDAIYSMVMLVGPVVLFEALASARRTSGRAPAPVPERDGTLSA